MPRPRDWNSATFDFYYLHLCFSHCGRSDVSLVGEKKKLLSQVSPVHLHKVKKSSRIPLQDPRRQQLWEAVGAVCVAMPPRVDPHILPTQILLIYLSRFTPVCSPLYLQDEAPPFI